MIHTGLVESTSPSFVEIDIPVTIPKMLDGRIIFKTCGHDNLALSLVVGLLLLKVLSSGFVYISVVPHVFFDRACCMPPVSKVRFPILSHNDIILILSDTG